MATTLTPISERERLARLCHDLGDIPLERIRRVPAPGSATEADLIAAMDRDDLACELVDGTLVEKAVGYYESMVAVALIRVLGDFVERHDLGLLMGEAATLRLWPGLVRMPDVSFVSWSHFPERELPAEPVPDLAPDLAVEVLSESNTRAEIERKLHEYFAAGTRLAWVVDSRRRTARAYTSPTEWRELDEDGMLTGEDVLPGFQLRLGDWLDRVPRRRAGTRRHGDAER